MFFWMLFIRLSFIVENYLNAYVDGGWGEKREKVKVEEQLVLTIAEDRNRNSDALSPNFPYMGKGRNPISEPLKQKHILHFVAEL